MAAPQLQQLVFVFPEGQFFDRAFAQLASLCATLPVTATRAPSEFSSADRLGQSCSAMERADLVVVDITGRNPNTLYLAGYAHGIGKRVLFLSQHGEDLSFDRSRHEVLVYHANLDLLAKSLEDFIRGTAPAPPADSPAAFSGQADARARFQTIFGDIMNEHAAKHTGEIRMENDQTFVLVEQNLDLPVVQALARRARELGLRIKLL